MYRKCGYSLIVAFFVSCLPGNPVLPERLAAPQLSFVDLEIIPDPLRGYRDAVHLKWEFKDNAHPHTYTLLRMLPGDSFPDVFTGSRGIPADSTDFYDDLSGYAFPEAGFDKVVYRITAVDTVGRAGDTSETCTVVLAPQPLFDDFSENDGCLHWESWIRGGVFSQCGIWRDSLPYYWKSEQMLVFPLTDHPAAFTACLPDSLLPLANGRWRYSLNVSANAAVSLLLGEFNVP